jgi:hypothetical protein
MAIDALTGLVIFGFNAGLALLPFFLSWTLTLVTVTIFLQVALIFLFRDIDILLEFAFPWFISILGAVQACIFLRGTITANRMLTFWHYSNATLQGHLRNQYHEIAARGVVGFIFVIEGVLFMIEDIRTVPFLAIRVAINTVVLVCIFMYFEVALSRPTVSHFYLALFLTSIFADVGVIIIASTVGEDASWAHLVTFFSIHIVAGLVTLIVTAIHGSTYNRLRAKGDDHIGSERLYPVFDESQLYSTSNWTHIPAWFRNSPKPIEYITEGSALHNNVHYGVSTEQLDDRPVAGDESYNSFYDTSALDEELSGLDDSMRTPGQDSSVRSESEQRSGNGIVPFQSSLPRKIPKINIVSRSATRKAQH